MFYQQSPRPHLDFSCCPYPNLNHHQESALGLLHLHVIGTRRLGGPSYDVLLPLAQDLLTRHRSVPLLPGPVALCVCSSLRSEKSFLQMSFRLICSLQSTCVTSLHVTWHPHPTKNNLPHLSVPFTTLPCSVIFSAVQNFSWICSILWSLPQSRLVMNSRVSKAQMNPSL